MRRAAGRFPGRAQAGVRALRGPQRILSGAGSVSFGPRLSLSCAGVSDGKRLLSWAGVADIRIDRRNRVMIMQKGRRMPWTFVTGQQAGKSILMAS